MWQAKPGWRSETDDQRACSHIGCDDDDDDGNSTALLKLCTTVVALSERPTRGHWHWADKEGVLEEESSGCERATAC